MYAVPSVFNYFANELFSVDATAREHDAERARCSVHNGSTPTNLIKFTTILAYIPYFLYGLDGDVVDGVG